MQIIITKQNILTWFAYLEKETVRNKKVVLIKFMHIVKKKKTRDTLKLLQ